MNVDNAMLNSEERERILQVMRRDADFRQFNRRTTPGLTAPNGRSAMDGQCMTLTRPPPMENKQLEELGCPVKSDYLLTTPVITDLTPVADVDANERFCVLCQSAFNSLFRKRVLCQNCGLYACRECVTWDVTAAVWFCNECYAQRCEMDRISVDWFQDCIRRKFRRYNCSNDLIKAEVDRQLALSLNTTTSNALHESSIDNDLYAHLDVSVKEVRKHVETLVESMLGEGVGDVSTLANKDGYQEKPLDQNESPTSAHATLRQILQEVIEEAVLRLTDDDGGGARTEKNGTSLLVINRDTKNEDDCLHSVENDRNAIYNYEHILATVILNKVIEKFQQDQTIVNNNHCSEQLPLSNTQNGAKQNGSSRHSQSEEDVDNGYDVIERCDNDVIHHDIISHDVTRNDVIGRYEESEQTDAESEAKRMNFEETLFQGMDENMEDILSPDGDGVSSSSSSDSSSSLGTESADEDFSWKHRREGGGVGGGGGFQYLIEEQIEEITTTVEDSDSDASTDRRSKRTVTTTVEPSTDGDNRTGSILRRTVISHDLPPREGIFAYLGSELDFTKADNVPFPELGKNVVNYHVGYDVSNDILTTPEPSGETPDAMLSPETDGEEMQRRKGEVFVTPIDRWEENWLFMKRRASARGAGLLGEEADPVSMLIPNPEMDVRPQIGNRDIDELSELSERHSVASCISFGSSETDHSFSQLTSAGHQRQLLAEIRETELDVVDDVIDDVGDDYVIDEDHQLDRDCSEDFSPVSEKKCLNSQTTSQLNITKASTKPVPQPRVIHTASPAPSPRLRRRSESNRQPASRETDEMRDYYDDYESDPASSVNPDAKRFLPVLSRPRPSAKLKFVETPESQSIHAGKAARFRCRITKPISVLDESKYEVQWFFGSDPIIDCDKYAVHAEDDAHHLEVYDTTARDGGTYSCCVYDQKGEESWTDFKLVVRGSSRCESRPEFVNHLSNETVEQAVPAVEFVCKVAGYPEPTVTWKLDGKPVRRSETRCIESTGCGEWVLRLSGSDLKDETEVTAEASNRLGQARSSAILKIVPANSVELSSLTRRVNDTQTEVHDEAVSMLQSANQLAILSRQLDSMDRHLSSLEVQFQERTWHQRQHDTNHMHSFQTSLARERRTTAANETADDGIRPRRVADLSSTRIVEGTAPPRPGSIAEREHLKWQQQAVSLKHNLYSPESLYRRLSRGATAQPNSRGWDTDDGHSLVLTADEQPRKIDCGLKEINPEMYKRDYYVRGKPAVRLTDRINNNFYHRFNGRSAIDAAEDRIYVAADNVETLEGEVDELEARVRMVEGESSVYKVEQLEDKVTRAVARVQRNDQQVKMVENEVSRLRRQFDECPNAKPKPAIRRTQSITSSDVTPVRKHDIRDDVILDRNDVMIRPGYLSLTPGYQNNLQKTVSVDNLGLLSPASSCFSPFSPDDDTGSALPSVRLLASRFEPGSVLNASTPDLLSCSRSIASSSRRSSQESARSTQQTHSDFNGGHGTISQLSSLSHNQNINKPMKSTAPDPAVGEISNSKIFSDDETRPYSLARSDRFSSVDSNMEFTGLPAAGSTANNKMSVSERRQFINGRDNYKRHSNDTSSTPNNYNNDINVKRVHSLTARSLSKEYREQARVITALPSRPMLNREPCRDGGTGLADRTAYSMESLLSPLGDSSDSSQRTSSPLHLPLALANNRRDQNTGYTSDESTQSSHTEGSTGQSRSKPRKLVTRSIQKRVAYWDRRVEEGLVSDNSLSEDFPPMDDPPR